jgi:hypothetical protein
MRAVLAIGIVTKRPPPFRLPVLNDRGDVAARLAAIDSMIIDESDQGEAPGDAPTAAASATPAEAISDQPANTAETDFPVRVRAAATVPARVRMLRPDGVPSAAPITYTADDWRGHIKGAPARADAHVYGAAGGLASAFPTRRGPDAVSVPTTPADPTEPAGDTGERTVGRREATGRAEPAETVKRVSVLDRAARIGLLGALLALFVLLFIFGPKISQWWSKL